MNTLLQNFYSVFEKLETSSCPKNKPCKGKNADIFAKLTSVQKMLTELNCQHFHIDEDKALKSIFYNTDKYLNNLII